MVSRVSARGADYLVLRGAWLLMIYVVAACLSARGALALPRATLDGMHGRGLRAASSDGLRNGAPSAMVKHGGLTARLRGGVVESEPETESEDERPPAPKLSAPSKPAPAAGKPPAAPAGKATPAADAPKAAEPAPAAGGDAAAGEAEAASAVGSEEGAVGEAATGEGGAEEGVNATRPPPSPEMLQMLNERLWEAAREGNEPMAQKALDGGASASAFCRGPNKWVNISMGEIAGADEAHCGLNLQWMELNNFTALHLAAASGNAGIIDMLVAKGADINAECLQRIHPFPPSSGMRLPFFSQRRPLIFKCTPLRLARAANCGRCFFTSYQKAVDKLEEYGAADRDFTYPLNFMVLGMAFLGAYLGLGRWPFDWFKEWPFNWADYPDMAKYTGGQQ